MKPLTLLLCLFLLGCEKRVADPDIDGVRTWLLSEKGRKEVTNGLARLIYSRGPKSIDQLVPIENWTVKRVLDDQYQTSDVWFALFAEEKRSDQVWLLWVKFKEGRFSFSVKASVIPGTKSEFEKLGDPVSLKRAGDLFEDRMATETARKMELKRSE